MFGTRKPLSGTNEDITPTHEESNIIYTFRCRCGSGYVGKTSQKSYLKQNQHVPKLNQKVDRRRWENGKKLFLCNWQPFLGNSHCAANYSEDRFSINARARNEFELHTMESIFIQTLKPELCKLKKFVYKTRLFKMLL